MIQSQAIAKKKPEPESEAYIIQGPVIIWVCSDKRIRDICEQLTGKRDNYVVGFHVDRTIWVRRQWLKDKNSKYLPDMDVLGHEIWHLKELGGQFHYK